MWILAVFNFLACFDLKITKFKFYGFCFIMTRCSFACLSHRFSLLFSLFFCLNVSKMRQDLCS